MENQESKKQLYEMLLQMKEFADKKEFTMIKILNEKYSPLLNQIFKLNDEGEEAISYDRARNNFLMASQGASYSEIALNYFNRIPKP